MKREGLVMLDRLQIKNKAEELLVMNHISMPPVSVEAIAASVGAAVQKVDLKDNLSGFSYPKGPQRTIGVNLRHAHVRQRFTIAHELGHLLMHTQDLHYDRQFSMQFRSEISAHGTDPKEVAANAFAAELLMPESCL
jgi:Zn-dependent peptidase ImmA (M78 family)